MRHTAIALAVLLAAPALAQQSVSPAAMIAAGKNARLADIDYGEKLCDSDMRVEDWLRQLTGKDAKRIVWVGGKCEIVGIGPGIDAQSHPWCARAEIYPARPLNRNDTPIVEIFLDRPRNGKPGPAYAFRGIVVDKDGPDMVRRRTEFAAGWRERFPDAPRGCQDSGDD
jgi:hypothetical protein